MMNSLKSASREEIEKAAVLDGWGGEHLERFLEDLTLIQRISKMPAKTNLKRARDLKDSNIGEWVEVPSSGDVCGYITDLRIDSRLGGVDVVVDGKIHRLDGRERVIIRSSDT